MNTWGLVTAIPVTCPPDTVAVPILTILFGTLGVVITPTLTTVWTPDLYPDPLLPTLTEPIVPAIETLGDPPASTNGWYPKPSSDPTETITPPLGKEEIPTSLVIVLAVPTKVTDVIPALCSKK